MIFDQLVTFSIKILVQSLSETTFDVYLVILYARKPLKKWSVIFHVNAMRSELLRVSDLNRL